MSDAILTRIFEQHYPDAKAALHRFDTHLASLALPPIEPDLYRLDIRWGDDGEPDFRVIPNPK